MNLAKGAQRKLLTAGALIAPVVLVQLFRGFGTTGPGSAHAAGPMPTDPEAPTQLASTGPKFAPEIARISAWIRSQDQTKRPQSPLDYMPVIAAPVAPANPYAGKEQPNQPAPKGDDVASKLAVGAIFGNAQGQMVTINGKVCSVGDEPLPGWLVTKIDPKAYVVHLLGPNDQVVKLSVRAGESKHN